MASPATRLASARAIADGRRIVATDIETRLRTRYSTDTMRRLHTLFPRVHFVWLMGADILGQLPRWRRFRDLVRHTAFAVLPRPSYNQRALAGHAAKLLRRARHVAQEASVLATVSPPAWVFLPTPQHTASATALRATNPPCATNQGV